MDKTMIKNKNAQTCFIEELPGAAFVSLSISPLNKDHASRWLFEKTSLNLPEPGKVSTGPNAALLWSGPDRYWYFSGQYDFQVFEEAATLMAVVDCSDGWCCWKVRGDEAELVLQNRIMLDLHPSVFLKGTTARSVFHHIPIIISNHDGWYIWSSRSSKDHFQRLFLR